MNSVPGVVPRGWSAETEECFDPCGVSPHQEHADVARVLLELE